jgi:hypothetical protein
MAQEKHDWRASWRATKSGRHPRSWRACRKPTKGSGVGLGNVNQDKEDWFLVLMGMSKEVGQELSFGCRCSVACSCPLHLSRGGGLPSQP